MQDAGGGFQTLLPASVCARCGDWAHTTGGCRRCLPTLPLSGKEDPQNFRLSAFPHDLVAMVHRPHLSRSPPLASASASQPETPPQRSLDTHFHFLTGI